MKLSDIEARVLGALVEKEITTPENYPLSLNALRNACNQSSSREPVMTLDEDEIRQGLHLLEDKGLAEAAGVSGREGRVAKYEHRMRDRLQLRRDETAVICLLLLRGPQTPGELRTRSERLFSFDGSEAVLSTLQRLAGRESPEFLEGPLTVLLARAPGAREARWAVTLVASPEGVGVTAQGSEGARVEAAGESALAEEVAELRREVERLRERMDRLEG